jgi:hypothetical protein
LISINVDPLVLNLDKKKIVKTLLLPIRNQLEPIIYSFQKFKDEDKIDLHIQLSTLILSLCAIISLNINVLKTGKILLHAQSIKKINKQKKNVDASAASDTSETEGSSDEEPINGGSIKTEFANAFAIIKNSIQYNLLLVSDDKIKAMLIDYYRKISKDVGDLVDISSVFRSNEDKLIREVEQSPIYAYLRYIVCRNKNITISDLSFDSIMGVSIAKNNNINIYSNIPKITRKNSDPRSKYISESFENIRTFIANDRYQKYEIEPKISEFVKTYEQEQTRKILNSTKNPNYYLDEINSREDEFHLANLNLIYCSNTLELQKHKWINNNCEICKIEIKSISQSHNDHIQKLIDREIARDAFFELYSMNCPIKDIHIYENDKCIQCGVGKQELLFKDIKYYNKYLSKFDSYRNNIVNQLIQKANSLIQTEKYISPTKPIINTNPNDIDADINKLTLIITNRFDANANDILDLNEDSIDSYMRLIYERYTYAMNVSFSMSKHSDVEFYDFIKDNFFKGTNPIKIKMEELPAYDYKHYSKRIKIYHLLTLFDTIAQNSSNSVINLGKFLIKKIIAQEMRRKDFNFAKLKTVKSEILDDDELIINHIDEDDEDMENNGISMFNAYDIDMDDMEDNVSGDLD